MFAAVNRVNQGGGTSYRISRFDDFSGNIVCKRNELRAVC